jgi:hypothetical protein
VFCDNSAVHFIFSGCSATPFDVPAPLAIGSEPDANDIDKFVLDISTVLPLTFEGRTALQLIIALPQETVAIRNMTDIAESPTSVSPRAKIQAPHGWGCRKTGWGCCGLYRKQLSATEAATCDAYIAAIKKLDNKKLLLAILSFVFLPPLPSPDGWGNYSNFHTITYMNTFKLRQLYLTDINPDPFRQPTVPVPNFPNPPDRQQLLCLPGPVSQLPDLVWCTSLGNKRRRCTAAAANPPSNDI